VWDDSASKPGIPPHSFLRRGSAGLSTHRSSGCDVLTIRPALQSVERFPPDVSWGATPPGERTREIVSVSDHGQNDVCEPDDPIDRSSILDRLRLRAICHSGSRRESRTTDSWSDVPTESVATCVAERMAHRLWMSGCRVASSRNSSRRNTTGVARRSMGLRDASHRSTPPYKCLAPSRTVSNPLVICANTGSLNPTPCSKCQPNVKLWYKIRNPSADRPTERRPRPDHDVPFQGVVRCSTCGWV
jgi:hypothetical protein